MLETVSKGLAYLGGAILLSCAGLVTLDVLFRNLFSPITFYSVELTTYGFAIAVACGYGYAILSKAHIRINVVYLMFPRMVRAILDLLAMFALSAMASALAYYAVNLSWENFAMGSRSTTTLSMPLFLPQTVWMIGLGWFALVTVVLLLKAARSLIRGRISEVENLLGLPTA